MINTNKLFIAIAISIVMIVFMPYLFSYFGWIGELKEKSWIILLIVGCGITIKHFINDTAKGEFLFHKSGYDNCLMTFAALFTAFALQVTSETDLFPGLESFTPLSGIPSRIGQITLLLILALVTSMGTAKILQRIENDPSLERGVQALFSTITGYFMFSIYILILISRG